MEPDQAGPDRDEPMRPGQTWTDPMRLGQAETDPMRLEQTGTDPIGSDLYEMPGEPGRKTGLSSLAYCFD